MTRVAIDTWLAPDLVAGTAGAEVDPPAGAGVGRGVGNGVGGLVTDGTRVGAMVGPLQQLSAPIFTMVEQAASLAEMYCVKVFACPQVLMALLKSDGKAWLRSMETPSQKAQALTLGWTSEQQKAE